MSATTLFQRFEIFFLLLKNGAVIASWVKPEFAFSLKT